MSFFFLGLFNSTDYSSYFLLSYSAEIEHSINKNRCSTTCQCPPLLSLASVLEEEISVMYLGGVFFPFNGQFITMRKGEK